MAHREAFQGFGRPAPLFGGQTEEDGLNVPPEDRSSKQDGGGKSDGGKSQKGNDGYGEWVVDENEGRDGEGI